MRIFSKKDFPSLSPLATLKNVSVHQLVLAYYRQKHPCVSLLVGCRRVGRVEELKEVMEGRVRFTKEEMEMMDGLIPSPSATAIPC